MQGKHFSCCSVNWQALHLKPLVRMEKKKKKKEKFANLVGLLRTWRSTRTVCDGWLSVRLSWSAKDECWAPDTRSHHINSPHWIYSKPATRNLSLNHDQRSPLVLSVSVFLFMHAALSHTYNISSFPNRPLVSPAFRSFSPLKAFLFMLVVIFSSPVFHHIPKPITSQSRRWEKSSITVSVGGYLGEWHVHSWKNDPTSNSGMNQRYH